MGAVLTAAGLLPGMAGAGPPPKFPSKFGYRAFGSLGFGSTTTNPCEFGPGMGSGSGDDGGLGFFLKNENMVCSFVCWLELIATHNIGFLNHKGVYCEATAGYSQKELIPRKSNITLLYCLTTNGGMTAIY